MIQIKQLRQDDVTATRTAIVMTVRNEIPSDFIPRLWTIKASLDRAGFANQFDYVILSDTSDPAIAKAEEAAVASWRAELTNSSCIKYRRRADNVGFKPGNVRDFCEGLGKAYDYMILLDADSLMTGQTILRLVRTMQANPTIGILQTLIVGVSSPSFFARAYEFGHRHAMRCTIMGSVWWQQDRCQYWGHNAAIRIAPFTAHCQLPYLPGKGPFGGHIMCHDQIEATLIHRAGYDVRVLPEESGSYEGTPPTLLDFTKRNHRWCQGNLKNLRVLGTPGLPTIDRFHLAVVAQRFLGWPALVTFATLSAVAAATWPSDVPFPMHTAFALYAIWMGMFFAPKLLGVIDAAIRFPSSYGGTQRLLLGAAVELAFTVLLAPVSMVMATHFMIALLMGRALSWEAQQRNAHELMWKEALKGLWLPTTCGALLSAFLVLWAPRATVWFVPFLASLVLSIPFAVVTSSSTFDRVIRKWRLCEMPEEVDMPPELAALHRP